MSVPHAYRMKRAEMSHGPTQAAQPFRSLCSMQFPPRIGYPRTLNGLRAIDEVTAS